MTPEINSVIEFFYREELEEFKFLWKEVRREITEMEQLIANRLGGLVMGNDNFNPLLALEIIHKVSKESRSILPGDIMYWPF